MLKKVHKCRSELCPRQQSLHCSLCRKHSCKAKLYVYNTGQITCDICRNMDNIKEYGDNTHRVTANYFNSISNCTPSKDFACGDCNEASIQDQVKQRTQKRISFSEFSEQQTQDFDKKPDVETMVSFKNPNYKDSGSSISCQSNTVLCSKTYSAHIIPPRPVVCPVEKCSKMVATDSVLLHFRFDHSKIPKLTLKEGMIQKIVLNAANVTTETQCIGVFTIYNENRHISSDDNLSASALDDQNPLLLLAVRLPTETHQTRIAKSETVILRSVTTQTDHRYQKNVSQHLCQNANLVNIDTNKSGTTGHIENQFSDDEYLIVWLCKVNRDNDNVCSVTLSKEDNNLSFTYTGHATWIRNKQDAFSVYQRSDCLTVKGIAANKLINNNKIDVMIKLI